MYLYLQGGGRDFNSVRMPTTDALVHLLSRSLRLRTHLPSLSAPPYLPAQPSSTHSAAAGGASAPSSATTAATPATSTATSTATSATTSSTSATSFPASSATGTAVALVAATPASGNGGNALRMHTEAAASESAATLMYAATTAADMEVGGSHMDASRRRTIEAAAGVIAGTKLKKSVVAGTNFQKSVCVCVLYIRWRRPIGCRIFIGHFPKKSAVISGSFAERNLQLQASHLSSPLYAHCL